MSKAYTSDGKRRSSQTHARRGRQCEFCSAYPHGNGGQVAHARKHVREGVAVELVRDMPYPFPPSRLFLGASDTARIDEFARHGYAVHQLQPTDREASP
jgi:hypothetical protein